MSEPSVSQRSAEDEQSIINTSADPQVEFSQSTAPTDDRPTSSSIVGNVESSIEATVTPSLESAVKSSEQSVVAESSDIPVDSEAGHCCCRC